MAERAEASAEHRADAIRPGRLFERADMPQDPDAGGQDDPVVRVDGISERAAHRLTDALHRDPLVEYDAQRRAGLHHELDGTVLRLSGHGRRAARKADQHKQRDKSSARA
jgi:hypothetical protein